jgi:hypothetical protein
MTKPFLPLMLIGVSCVLLLLPAGARGQQTQPSSDRAGPEHVPISGSAQAGSVSTEQATAPGASGSSVNTLNTAMHIQGPFQGSTPAGIATREPLPLQLDEVI